MRRLSKRLNFSQIARGVSGQGLCKLLKPYALFKRVMLGFFGGIMVERDLCSVKIQKNLEFADYK